MVVPIGQIVEQKKRPKAAVRASMIAASSREVTAARALSQVPRKITGSSLKNRSTGIGDMRGNAARSIRTIKKAKLSA